MIDRAIGILVAAGAAVIAYIIIHDYYGVLNPTIAKDALAVAGMLAVACMASFLSSWRKRS